MQYFDSSLAEQTFRVIASRLEAEIDSARRRLHTITDEQAREPRSADKWSPAGESGAFATDRK